MWYSMDMDASISRMLVFLKRFERAIVTVLIVLMVLVIALFSVTGAFAWSSPAPRDGASAPVATP